MLRVCVNLHSGEVLTFDLAGIKTQSESLVLQSPTRNWVALYRESPVLYPGYKLIPASREKSTARD